jgi:hypothetical protein
MVLTPEHIAFDVQAFDSVIASHGVTFEHYRAILCPLGLTDKFDARSHAGHSNCSNGFIYKKAGEITGLFTQNQTMINVSEGGIFDGSTVQVTLPRFYDDHENEREVLVQHFDRFFLKNVPANTVTTQKFEAHQSGIDRMQYSVTKVDHLIDSNGVEYEEGTDFTVCDGHIKWIGTKRPGYDPVAEKGTICSIRYAYCPFWYVKNLMHEIRVSRDLDPLTGIVGMTRMPYAVLLQREWVFENAERSQNGEELAKVVPSARDGGFSPR